MLNNTWSRWCRRT